MKPQPGATPATATHLPLQGYFLLMGLTLFWGMNWPFMKMALTELPVWWFRTACLVVGGVGLLTLARLSGGVWSFTKAEVRPLMLVSLFGIVGWHLNSAYGVSLMPAGRAAIIAFTMPVWASILGSILLGEAFTRAKVVGLILGMAGLAVLIGPDLVAVQTAPLGAFFMLMAAITWAIGTVLVKRFTWKLSVTALAGWQLIFGTVPILTGALLLEPVPDLTTVSDQTILAALYIFALPMIFCQWAFLKTVRLFPASIAAIGTLAIPIVGVYASSLILGEPVGWRELGALGLICAALFGVLVMPAIRCKILRI